ncbi:hypothetical protein MASSI9I_60371 [Massilia sp. 9I]|nr:hypothetical protein MASSI9I_60371 [Massilia sp. 9I]
MEFQSNSRGPHKKLSEANVVWVLLQIRDAVLT